jgi:hypothetical protein
LKHKRLQIAKAILSKKEQCWRYYNTQLQIYYRAIAIKKKNGTNTKTDMKTSGRE